MDFDWRRGELAEGLRCYRSGRYFEAHEAWESVWLRSIEPDKTFLQAIIQVAAAFHHLGRANPEGARNLLMAAERRLGSYPGQFGGLSVALLREEIRERIAALNRGLLASELSPVPIVPEAA